jgi:hypothetical protein
MRINKALGTLTLSGEESAQYYTDEALRRAFLECVNIALLCRLLECEDSYA